MTNGKPRLQVVPVGLAVTFGVAFLLCSWLLARSLAFAIGWAAAAVVVVGAPAVLLASARVSPWRKDHD